MVNYIKYWKIDILLIQEHNLKERHLICNDLLEVCDIYINLAINQKGGTATLINRNLNYGLISNEMSADSRIISTKIKIYKTRINLVNVYAPASATHIERDAFFQNFLMYYSRSDTNNVILGGDWNCIINSRDCSSDNIHLSKALLNIVRSIRCKDAWNCKNRNVEYTYVRQNYGSRIDRIYVKDIANYIASTRVVHVNFSDHSGIEMSFNLPEIPKVGRYYWKMNVALLDKDNIKEDFQIEWDGIKNNINRYDTINDWWEIYAKTQIKNFFINKGREENAKKYGLLEYLEYKLNRLYEIQNRTGQLNYPEVKEVKDRVNAIKAEILEGVKIRNRMDEQVEGEKVSAYLIGKHHIVWRTVGWLGFCATSKS